VASIHWKPDAPTWEEHQAAADRLARAQQEHEEILRARERADYYAQRMGSGEVLSADELDTIRKDLDAMPQAVRAEMEADRGAAAGKMAKATVSRLSEEFSRLGGNAVRCQVLLAQLGEKFQPRRRQRHGIVIITRGGRGHHHGSKHYIPQREAGASGSANRSTSRGFRP
jgi:hypothetical protein